ncbi:MAG: PAS domain S-box protein [Candidatus Delongbacteria bacterium]|nr:PAS domain S-box protein [Candidatus Delongbacteria bacterium]MBN2836284.1 PAS domain S-box protein [Candidatus Delongbacteria bacterium]
MKLDIKRNINLPDFGDDQIIESVEYTNPDKTFFICYTTYKNGILFGILRGLSQVEDVVNYFRIRDRMIENAGYERYVEIRDNTEDVNTTREGRAIIVKYYENVHKKCIALIFAGASLVVNIQVKIGKKVIRNKELFVTTTPTIEKGIKLGLDYLNESKNKIGRYKLIEKDEWKLDFNEGSVKYRLIFPNIVFIDFYGIIRTETFSKLLEHHKFFISDNSLGFSKIFLIHDLSKISFKNTEFLDRYFNEILEKYDNNEIVHNYVVCRYYFNRFWMRLWFNLHRKKFSFVKNLRSALLKIDKSYVNVDYSKMMTIKESDFDSIFTLIQKINFDFKEEMQIPETEDKRMVEIYESLYLLRDDLNVYISNLNEKYGELQKETARRESVEQDLYKKNIELQNANNYIASIFNTIADGISVIDFNGIIIDCNDALLEMSGYQREDIGKLNVFDYYGDEDKEKFYKLMKEYSNGGSSVFEAKKRVKGDKYINVLISSSVMIDNYSRKKLIVSVVRDISEMKKNQKELVEKNQLLQNTLNHLEKSKDTIIRQEKLASLGTMIAGIAHEINNPTQAIKFSLDSFKLNIRDVKNLLHDLYETCEDKTLLEVEKFEKIYNLKKNYDVESIIEELEDFSEINLKSVNKIENIVQSSKKMARADSNFHSFDFNQMIKDSLILIENQIKYNVNIDTDIQKDLPMFYGLPQELGQVVINLVINSKDSIVEKGLALSDAKIVISTRFISERNSILLTIQDNGKGIKKELVDKVFDPFFTTKDIGKGTGLGLHLVHQIIDVHQGSIDISSELEKGTTFFIELPLKTKH